MQNNPEISLIQKEEVDQCQKGKSEGRENHDTEDRDENVCQVCGHMSLVKLSDHSRDHMTRIISHLYLGSKFNAQNPRELRYHEIQTVINVAWEAQRPCSQEFKYLKYHWDDVPEFDILVEMDQIVDQIHHEISEGRNLLVHCAAGKSRSASVVIGYLIKYFKMSFGDAYDYVKAYRGSIEPNQGFVEQLKKYSSCDEH